MLGNLAKKLRILGYDSKYFTSILISYKIPVDEWGKGYAKTLNHLFEEIKNEECTIKEIDGYLVRTIEYVGVRVLYEDNVTWLLKEDRQVFNDGRIRRRKMPSSVSEKMKFGEDATISASRGISEELGIDVNINQLIKGISVLCAGANSISVE